jgi:acyl-CoA synthetase (AMP-forming)/AMP-acid ligase II
MAFGDQPERAPDKPAAILATTGDVLTFGDLDRRSRRLARLLQDRGLLPGDHFAVLLPNTLRYFEAMWAGRRAGLYYTPVNWHLTVDEAAYIVDDSGSRALIASAAVGDLAVSVAARAPALENRLAAEGDIDGFEDLDAAIAGVDDRPPSEESAGSAMYYSSGTTGRPKGILRPRSGLPFGAGTPLEPVMTSWCGFGPDTVYLCPAPLYHAAPLGWSLGTQQLGGTVLVMERFDALEALALIERYHVTHAQFVPTMFVRMLKLTPGERLRFDLSSLRSVIHAAAPCPVDVKQQMIDWWGPILQEYYAGSEGNGFCAIDSEDWLAHRGSVGRPFTGTVHVLDDAGHEQPEGAVGTVWFEGTARFEYHNDPSKTAEAFNDRGWSTLGDMGYLDREGYLYLTDRKSHMIISGGVNIYPQEVENLLALHPKVADVAVIGVPHAEMGQEVKAVVQPAVMPADEAAADALELELIAYCRERLAHFKCPRSVDFDPELPRLPSGKLFKRRLRDRYEAVGDAAPAD